MSRADRLQEEILRVAIDYAPDPALVRIYEDLNTRHFRSFLPAIPVAWEPRLAEVGPLAEESFTLEGMFGHIGDKAIILINPGISGNADALRRALSHEMVHAYLYTIGDQSTDHGPSFQATLKRISAEGAFAAVASTAAERESLRTWLEDESARLEMANDQTRRESEALALETREIESSLSELTARRGPGEGAGGPAEDPAVVAWRNRRDAHNRRVEEFRARSERLRTELGAFNEKVERYNLMVAYPDGLDE